MGEDEARLICAGRLPQGRQRGLAAAASSRTSLIAREGSSRVACVAVCLAPNGQIVSQVHASRVMARVPGVHAIKRSPSLIPDPDVSSVAAAPNRDGVVSTAITYPHPRHARRSARRQSGQHDGPDPKFPTHSPQTSNPPDPVQAFAQVTGLRSNNLLNARTRWFSIPPPGIRTSASDRVSASEAL